MSDLLTREEVKGYMALVEKLPSDSPEVEKVWRLLKRDKQERCRQNFLPFVREMWPPFIGGKHHQIMAEAFERVARGDLKRLIINMPPRHTKSEFASYLFPSWYLGLYPEKKVIQTAHTAELAVGFGRKVRNLVGSQEYQNVFQTKLSSDSKAAGRWNTDKGGDYFAIGVGGAVTGKGADILIIDDPHSEQEAMMGSPTVYERVFEWYSSGPRQRLQPGGSIVIVMTRWSKKDLTGQILQSAAKKDSDEWEVIELPALMPSGKPLWPEFWKREELESIKLELPVGKWEAQYQQNPTSEEGAIIKREMWMTWENEKPPEVDYIIQSWDTAFEKNNRADYSACTTWGVFYREVDGMEVANIIVLDAFKERMEFPELKRTAYDMWKEWNPDTLLVEKKAAGAPLIYEMRRMGIPISEYTPSKGSDKIARVNAISDLFASGMVWRPETKWADELVEEVASFPNGDHDDLVDSTSQALLRFRQGGLFNSRRMKRTGSSYPAKRRITRKTNGYREIPLRNAHRNPPGCGF
jgi:predicted phage terminase large subunit-like protein